MFSDVDSSVGSTTEQQRLSCVHSLMNADHWRALESYDSPLRAVTWTHREALVREWPVHSSCLVVIPRPLVVSGAEDLDSVEVVVMSRSRLGAGPSPAHYEEGSEQKISNQSMTRLDFGLRW